MIDRFVETHPMEWAISGWICGIFGWGLFALFIYAITHRSKPRKPKDEPPPEPEED